MKKILLAILLVAALALPAAASQLDVFTLLPSGAWSEALSRTDVNELARAWKHGENGGYCNKQTWDLPVTINASIAQWIDWDITGTGWDWQVRKPGIFAADCTEFLIASNDNVQITFANFNDLYNATDEAYLETYYAVGGQSPPASGWVRASNLNETSVYLPYDLIKRGQDGTRYSTKLWNKIVVDESTRACEYTDSANVYITALDFKSAWLDPNDGLFLVGTGRSVVAD